MLTLNLTLTKSKHFLFPMILVTGASGLLGRQVLKTCGGIGTAYSRAKEPLLFLNLLDTPSLEQFLLTHKPEIVIHCAAERRPDVALKNEQETLELNVGSSRQLARLCKQLGIYLIYISTDYVFDGSILDCTEATPTNPLQFYGNSKLEGEKAVLEETDHSLILRVPVLYGQVTFNGESAVNTLVDAVLSQKEQKMDHHSQRYPTNVQDVAQVLKQLVERKQKLVGLYHFSAAERMTKYEMCLLFGKILNKPTKHLIPDTSSPPGAQRPKEIRLNPTKLKNEGINTDCCVFEEWFKANL
ncbi:hypothetical protein EDD86DRAFT_205586 [Gorgonomyces haynaldii]|nr:hypothetical protein EDD86DRAFT_205586 [Gorgonomyces haynaldii]